MQKLETIIKRYKKDSISLVRISCATLSGFIVDGMAVDTGSARASWNASKGAPVVNNIYISPDDPTPPRNNFTEVANSIMPGETFTFVNGIEYMGVLEYEGHSAQMPNGVLRVNVARWDSIVRGVLGRGI